MLTDATPGRLHPGTVPRTDNPRCRQSAVPTHRPPPAPEFGTKRSTRRQLEEAAQPIEQPKDRLPMDECTRRRTLVRRGGYILDFLLVTRNAWLRLRIREQDREPGAILGARPRGQPRTTTDVHGEHVCGSEREGRLAGPVRTLGRGLPIKRCSTSSQSEQFHAEPPARPHHKPLPTAVVVSILVSVALVLPCSPTSPGRLLRSLQTARTPVNSGGGNLESKRQGAS
jgi:hypothetical protein